MARTITIQGTSFDVNPEGYEHFWKDVDGKSWEPETFRIFRDHIDDTTLMLDIGAWIGPTALFAAQYANRTVAFEPDPVAFPRLSENLALNSDAAWHDRVTLVEKAVNSTPGEIPFGSSGAGGDSMSSVLFAKEQTQWTVSAVTLQDVLDEHSKPDQKVFLKIDIEGGEFSLIPQIKDILAQPRVTAYISLHPHFLRRSLKKSVSKVFGVPNFMETRRQYLKIYRSLVAALPKDREIWIDGKRYRSFTWFLAHAWLRLRSPNDLLIKNRQG